MFHRSTPWILAALGVTLVVACHKSTPAPEQGPPSAAFERYQRVHQEAASIQRQVKRGLDTESASEAATRMEQLLTVLEPEITKLPKKERPHARRYVDQTLSLLEEIQDLLEERQAAASP